MPQTLPEVLRSDDNKGISDVKINILFYRIFFWDLIGSYIIVIYLILILWNNGLSKSKYQPLRLSRILERHFGI